VTSTMTKSQGEKPTGKAGESSWHGRKNWILEPD
jgi:hypothetical protein